MGLPDLSLALSTKSTSEDISAACTAASGFKIVVKLSNASASSHQAYKCKTNAPRRWSVRPNGGVIAPGEEIEVVFKLCGSTMQGLAQDRHLILTAPVAADEARRLLKQRAERPRSSPEAPDLETPGVSQRRLTPQFDAWPGSNGGVANGHTDTDASEVEEEALPPTMNGVNGMHTPASTMATSPDGIMSDDGRMMSGGPKEPPPSAGAQRRMMSVQARVAEIDRRNSGGTLSVGSLGDVEEGEGEESVPSEYASRTFRWRRHSFIGWLLDLLGRMSEELVPWLSWKVYDVLFALAMLYLGRRVQAIRYAREEGIV